MSFALFAVPNTDLSVYYLGQIFGGVSSVLAPANAPFLMGTLLNVLNTAALSLGALIVTYTTIVGLMQSAAEGEFMGKKWSSLWVPIRTVLGIMGLFPLSGGYSAIQVIIMWMILQGVGLADSLWNTTLGYLQQVGGSPVASFDLSNMGSTNARTQMDSLFQGLVCQESMAQTTFGPEGKSVTNSEGTSKTIRYYCGVNSNDWCTSFATPIPASVVVPSTLQASVNPPKYTMGPSGVCGTVKYCNDAPPDPTSGPAATSCTATAGPVGGLAYNTAGAGQPTSVPAACTADLIAQTACYNPASLSCKLCKAQRQVLPGVVSALDNVAANFVKADAAYTAFYTTDYHIDTSPLADKPLPTAKAPWVASFCTAQQVATGSCCADSLNPGCSFMNNTFGINYSPIRITTSGSLNLPDVTNPGTDALAKIYAPYYMNPLLNGQDFIAAAVSQYTGALGGAYQAFLQQQIANSRLSDWYAGAAADGWIMAGTYYFRIANNNNSNAVSSDSLPKFEANVPTSLSQEYSDYRNNMQAASEVYAAMDPSGQNQIGDILANSGANGGMLSTVQHATSGVGNSVLTGFVEAISGKASGQLVTDPLHSIAAYGYSLILGTELAYMAILITGIGSAIGTSVDPMVLGTGITVPILWSGMQAIWAIISPFVFAILAGFFALGVTLGFYVPLIPYIIFTMGAIGWFMATIEAMVAGPVIALGILSPSGQHEILGKAEPAAMILFNLILRPSLMVLGMMISMLLSVVVVTLLNQGFMFAVQDIFNQTQTANPAIMVLALVGYTSLLVTVLNKSFSLIHVIPEKILTYIGGQAISYGEGEALQQAKSAVEGAGGQMSKSMQESEKNGSDGVGAHMNRYADAKKRKKEEDDKRDPAGISASPKDEKS